jgi:hypothetical protein
MSSTANARAIAVRRPAAWQFDDSHGCAKEPSREAAERRRARRLRSAFPRRLNGRSWLAACDLLCGRRGPALNHVRKEKSHHAQRQRRDCDCRRQESRNSETVLRRYAQVDDLVRTLGRRSVTFEHYDLPEMTRGARFSSWTVLNVCRVHQRAPGADGRRFRPRAWGYSSQPGGSRCMLQTRRR